MNIPPRRYWKVGATFSPDRLHRYRLWRRWHHEGPLVCFIGVNPSKADEHDDDNTVTRCIDFAQRWDFSGLLMMNAFAYVATDVRELLLAVDPIGPDNNEHLVDVAMSTRRVVMAWGSKKSPRALHRLVQTRGAEVRALVAPLAFELGHLGLNDDASPKHPLFLPRTTEFQRVTP